MNARKTLAGLAVTVGALVAAAPAVAAPTIHESGTAQNLGNPTSSQTGNFAVQCAAAAPEAESVRVLSCFLFGRQTGTRYQIPENPLGTSQPRASARAGLITAIFQEPVAVCMRSRVVDEGVTYDTPIRCFRSPLDDQA